MAKNSDRHNFLKISNIFYANLLLLLSTITINIYPAATSSMQLEEQSVMTKIKSEEKNQRELMNAIIAGNVPAVKNFLGSSIIDINARDKDGDTALTLAAGLVNKEMVELLIENGANVNIADRGENTPLIWSVKTNKPVNKDLVALLLNKGAEINARGTVGQTALIYAVDKGRKDIINLLLKAGADVDIASRKLLDVLSRETALTSAIKTGQKDIVELLLKAGADINFVNEKGERPVDIARLWDHPEIVKLLDAEKERREAKVKQREEYIKKTISEHLPTVLSNIVTDYAVYDYKDVAESEINNS